MRIAAYICVLLLLLPVANASAQQSPVIYSKTVIRITPKPETKAEIQKDGKEAAKPGEVLPQLPRVTKEFTLEVRPLSFLNQPDFLAHQPFTDKEGMMFVIEPSQVVELKSANLLARVDVLFVAEDGRIAQIAPDISLPELSAPLSSDVPVHAFVFLKEGTAKSSDIRPGDSIENPLFKTNPILLK